MSNERRARSGLNLVAHSSLSEADALKLRLRLAETARGTLTERGHGADDGHKNQGEHDRVFDRGRGGRVGEKSSYAAHDVVRTE